MSLAAAYVLGVLALAFAAVIITILAIMAAYAEEESRLKLDDVRALWQEREALRVLRARYASGKVGFEEFKEITLELQESLPR